MYHQSYACVIFSHYFAPFVNIMHLFLIYVLLYLFLPRFLPLTLFFSMPPLLYLPLEINFTLHYQLESLQTQTHRRNHTNRLHTPIQWAFPPGLTHFHQYKHAHMHGLTQIQAVPPFVFTLLYFYYTRQENESGQGNFHITAHMRSEFHS